MFRVQDGLLHFVFCNEDSYLRDSFVRLDLTDELHYLLTKQGFQGIYFIAGRGDGVEVRFLDEESQKNFPCKKFTELVRLHTFWQQNSVDFLDAEETGTRVAQLLTGHKRRSAVVFQSLEDFQGMVEASESLREVLCGNRTATRDSIVVLLTRPKASVCLPGLTGENNVFALADYAMCPELKHAVNGGGSDLFQEMKKRLKDRCIFLNELSEERIYALLEDYLMFTAPEFMVGEQELEDAVCLIYTWYHSEEMQLDPAFSRLLPENPEGSFSKLRDSLPKVWGDLTQKLSLLRRNNPGQTVRQILARQYPVEYRCPVEADTELAQRVQRLIRQALEQSVDTKFSIDRQTLRELEREYTTFYGQPPGRMMKWLLLRCVDWAQESMCQEDKESFLRCLKLLKLAQKQRLQWPEEEDREAGWKSWHTLLEYSRMWFHTGCQLRQTEERIAEQERVLDARLAEAQRRREEGFSEHSVVLQNILKGVEDCRDRMENLKEINNQTAEFRRSLNKDLIPLEYYAENFCDTVSPGQLAKLKAAADQASDRIKQTQNHYKEYMDSHTDSRYRPASRELGRRDQKTAADAADLYEEDWLEY